MRIKIIPVLQDNYSYLVIDEASNQAALIDTADDLEHLLPAIEAEKVTLTHILNTHHHADHSGGNQELIQKFPGVVVVGGAHDADRIFGVTQSVSDGDVVKVGSLSAQVIHIPCHTRGHVAYLFDDALFSGDTLFIAGCGRFFEGDAAQMHQALNGSFAALPGHTRVYCGHEYTVSNLRFALHVEPDNQAAQKKIEWANQQRAQGLPTVPGLLSEELSFNPFMRVSSDKIKQATQQQDPVEVMNALRTMKNNFK
jgi:hydroxyacylglutathione hydrolase